MKKTSTALLVVIGALCGNATPARAADNPMNVTGVEFVPTANIKWSDVPGMADVQIAPLDGDPGKGPSHFFLKFAGGFAAPIHHHTANHFVTVVTGTLVLTIEGKEHRLPAGSYFSFSNKTKHTTRCETGKECILAMDVRGKWDVVLDGDKAVMKK
ncbi:MAG TPA: cupin domain-containing protein [Candidatus Limnocylindrales bacterium]|jgi:quercetin dioxygenase-like cupin family protein|nr:cupin domain-containing protein [Candidatus Limnocylindrales bacterium]